MLEQLAALIGKELMVLLRTARGVATLVVPPVLQLLLFGYAATFDVNRAPIAILNEDLGPLGRELGAHFDGVPLFSVVALPTNGADAQRLVDNADVVMVLHIGQRFSADLGRGSPADVQLIVDGRNLSTALSVQSYAATVIARFNEDYLVANGMPRPSAVTVTRAWFNPNLFSQWYVISGLVAKILLIVTLASTAVSLTHERDVGTFDRLLAAPLHPLQILMGKAFVAFFVGFVQGLILVALAVWWFELPFRGSMMLFALALAAMMLSAVGIGLLISATARTEAQAIVGALSFVVPAIMLSGFATPIASMPGWMQIVTTIDPLRYFMAITRDLLLRGGGWDRTWPQLWPMAAIGIATLSGAWLCLRLRRN